MRKKGKSESGFTLVEVLTVIALIGILVVIPVKMLTQADQRTMLRQHVREIVGELYSIRNNAASMCRSYRLNINENAANESIYTMQIDYWDESAGDWVKDKKRPSIDLERKFLQNITDNATPAEFPLTLAYNSRGQQIDDAGNPILTNRTFTFTNEKVASGDNITVNIHPFGGIRVTDNFSD